MLNKRLFYVIPILSILCFGCNGSQNDGKKASSGLPGKEDVIAANKEFLNRKKYDPWLLKYTPGDAGTNAYISDGKTACIVDKSGAVVKVFQAGHYSGSSLQPVLDKGEGGSGNAVVQELDLRTGIFKINGKEFTYPGYKKESPESFWRDIDIVIDGDDEAQQVIHSNLFYLLSSTSPGSDNSIPPMGLSSNIYAGHIFWDAETWMFPALVPQYPNYAKSIIAYRYKRLGEAVKNAQSHKYAGAQYPWESADKGNEVAPAEFAQERHITADVGLAAWQYYLWTGDQYYLTHEGWPVIEACAKYWKSRVKKSADGKYHIYKVISPDETAGVVDDDLYTNGVVAEFLQAASKAASIAGKSADPDWLSIAKNMYFTYDKSLGIPAEHEKMNTANFNAKQADAVLYIYPLDAVKDNAVASKMLDWYSKHTMKAGPAMTESIHSIIAAKLGQDDAAYNYFQDSYRPFMRGSWNAFSEKRSMNNIYFMTGMAGTLQSVLYGFAGLKVVTSDIPGKGTKLAGDNIASLYADPHLPKTWNRLMIHGIRFRNKVLDLIIEKGNKVMVHQIIK